MGEEENTQEELNKVFRDSLLTLCDTVKDVLTNQRNSFKEFAVKVEAIEKAQTGLGSANLDTSEKVTSLEADISRLKETIASLEELKETDNG